jgi:S-adenosylmethionine:tRNA ribosyltransferase-isomerase
MLDELSRQGIQQAFVTLHVGAGTFQPIRVENITEHKMHSEVIDVPLATCEKIQKTKAEGGRVIAVGTTSVRCLETVYRHAGARPYQGETDIFIYPGYTFECVDALLTNFHLPESSLIMLVAALAGYFLTMDAYQTAVAEKYRFFSYGDAMFIS